MYVWMPSIGNVLQCEKETGNIHDLYAVAIKKQDVVVGHMLQTISTLCHLFLSSGGTITYTVTGVRKYSNDLPQGGLEIPCQLAFRGDGPVVEKAVKKLLPDRPKDSPRVFVKTLPVQKTIEEVTKANRSPEQSSCTATSCSTVISCDGGVKKIKIDVGSKLREPAEQNNTSSEAEAKVPTKVESCITVEPDSCITGDKVVWLNMCHIQLLESFGRFCLPLVPS